MPTALTGRLGEASLPTPPGRGASHPSSDIASQCSLRSGDMTRPLTPCRPHTHKYGRGAIDFSFAPLPQLSHAPDFFIFCGVCRSGRLGEASLPANLLVGAALRADRLLACYLTTHRMANGHSSASLQSLLRTGFFAT